MAKKQISQSNLQGQDLGEDIPADEKPIDDFFWFKLSRGWVLEADQKIQKQAENIQLAIKWFFGLGTSATVLSVFFKDFKVSEVNVFWLASALFSLLVAYATSVISATSFSKTIEEPNSSDSIRQAFNQSNRWARFWLLIASIFLIFGMSLMGPAFFYAFRILPIPEKEILSATSEVQELKNKKYLSSLSICATLKDSVWIYFRIDTGKTLAQAKSVNSFKYFTLHRHVDFIYKLHPCINVPASNSYLTAIFKVGEDSLVTKSAKIR